MATKSTLSNVMACFIENLQLVLRQLEGGDSKRSVAGDFSKDTFWDKLQTSVKAVSNEVTKLSMMFSKPPWPSVEHCEPMVKRVECATLSMVSAFYGLPKSQGLRLRISINKAVLDVVQSIINFAATLKEDTIGSPDQLKSTGCVWQNTDAFDSLPKDNREVVLIVLRDTFALVKDAAEELQESVEGGLGDDFNDFTDDLVNEEDNSNAWSEKDKAIVNACLGLIKVTRSSLKKSTEAVKKNGQCDNDAKIAQLDDLADHMDRLSPLVDDLVETLYPPLKLEASEVNAQKLTEKVKTCLLFLRQSQLIDEDDFQWLEFLLTASQHNMDKISSAIQNP